MAEASFWDNQEKAQERVAERKGLIGIVKPLDEALKSSDDLAAMLEMAAEDESFAAEVPAEVERIEKLLEELKLRALLNGPHDAAGAILTINARDGGTDANDWAEMLLRMYLRWAERRGFDVDLESVNDGGEAGISSATFVVKGRNAYGLLRSEHGVHRLVRISPFDNNNRRQTSFASIKVTPFIEDVDSEIEIDDKDLRIDVYRSSGAGGQHVNVTDSAVRITHLPTGVVTSCQNERSQHQNKDRAMKTLKAKLLELERAKRQDQINEITGDQSAVNFGSQDRNYVLQPYQQVKDLRSGLELSNPDAVLDGDLDGLMEAYLRWQRAS